MNAVSGTEWKILRFSTSEMLSVLMNFCTLNENIRMKPTPCFCPYIFWSYSARGKIKLINDGNTNLVRAARVGNVQSTLHYLPSIDIVVTLMQISIPAPMKSCSDLYNAGKTCSGVYTIDPDGSGVFDVFCDQTTAGGGWTVLQKRVDGSVDFYLGWADYKNGFGNLNGEFWLGLDNIHRLTNSDTFKLRVDLEDWEGETRFAEYDMFSIADEASKYRLSLGSYSGTCYFMLCYVMF